MNECIDGGFHEFRNGMCVHCEIPAIGASDGVQRISARPGQRHHGSGRGWQVKMHGIEFEWPSYDPLHVGFTGSREAPSDAVGRRLGDLLKPLPYSTVAHHGCCLGFDALVHYTAISARHKIVLHQPEKRDHVCTTLRLTSRCVSRVPKPYLVRDQDIVNESHILIASPLLPEADPLSKRSGTWATIRMARRKNIPIWHIRPNGLLVPDRHTLGQFLS